jgi:hypothetical protein
MILPRKVVQDEIVLVHPLARLDCTRGKTDDLPVLSHGFIRRDRRRRHLMPARNALARGCGRNDGAR